MKIIITGASRGIGLFLAQKFSADGYQVFGTYNQTGPTETMNCQWAKVDITDHKAVADWISSVVQPNDDITLINCAGINYNAVAHKADTEKWRRVIDVNLIGSFNMINAVLPLMREKSFGRIINFSSVVAQKGVPGTSAYAASKAALWGLSRCIAVENAKKGITINNINLGYFDIGMIAEVPEEILAGIKKTIPAQDLGKPDNIYHAIKFFIASDYTTGTSIDVNGGLY